MSPVLAKGQPDVPLGQRPFVDIEAVSPEWFETMRVPLRAGGGFTNADTQSVMIGRVVQPYQVVGVAADVKNQGLALDTQPEVYVPFAQLPWGKMNLLVRTAVKPEAMAERIRAQIAAVDADQPVTKVRTVTQLMSEQRAQPKFLLAVVGVFSGTALVLALIGIYSMLSYAVAERQKEFGIRLALGAGRADILRLV